MKQLVVCFTAYLSVCMHYKCSRHKNGKLLKMTQNFLWGSGGEVTSFEGSLRLGFTASQNLLTLLSGVATFEEFILSEVYGCSRS